MTTAIKRVFDDEDTIETTPDTSPDTEDNASELVEAVEWLKRAGIVSNERPPFERFFEELAEPEAKRVVTELSGAISKAASNDD